MDFHDGRNAPPLPSVVTLLRFSDYDNSGALILQCQAGYLKKATTQIKIATIPASAISTDSGPGIGVYSVIRTVP
ncbi:hypothetical protein LGM72_32485 [Burkholderia contaminans]|uniref:hypothetical protein n=1 Tax=Burkholderia contaminans TaxID=488447 RepID=UPI001CF4AE0E|nr:hypothetical protein [Burkholderia contaminans]MCA8156739.1 hypothetical protein [Burkholderia contaminans]